MTAVIEARQLGKRYRRKWALADCSLSVPTGTMAGPGRPERGGKTTLLSMITGCSPPTAGRIEVAGGAPGRGAGQLAKVGFVAQDAPVYAGISVADHSAGGPPEPGLGRMDWPGSGSGNWVWTRRRRPGGCPAGSGRNWP